MNPNNLPLRQYFDDGWRTGYEVASRIDDDGNASYRIEIIPPFRAADPKPCPHKTKAELKKCEKCGGTGSIKYKPRYRWFKESDTLAVQPVVKKRLCPYHQDSLTWDSCTEDFEGCEAARKPTPAARKKSENLALDKNLGSLAESKPEADEAERRELKERMERLERMLR